MILKDDGFFAELDDSFMCYITGRLGSGKTLLAVELCERYLKKGYKMLSQISCVWNDDIDSMKMDEYGRRKVVVLIDEVGLYFRKASTAGSVSSFARKQNCYLIFAGRKAPHEDLCDLSVQLWFDFFKWFLIPLKVWRFDRINGRKTYHGYIYQTAWWEYYGVYDTLDPGDNPSLLVETVRTWTRQFFERYGRRYAVSDVDASRDDDQTEGLNELLASVRKVGEVTKDLSSVARKSVRGRW